MPHHALEQVGVVVDADLVGHCQQQRVGGSDGLVLGELRHQLLGLPGVGLAEARGTAVELADLVLAGRLAAEVGAVVVADDREDAAADRDPWLPGVPGGAPRVPEALDLLGLEPKYRKLSTTCSGDPWLIPSWSRPLAIRSAALASSTMYSGVSYRMSITPVPISIRSVRAQIAASSGNGDASWRA